MKDKVYYDYFDARDFATCQIDSYKYFDQLPRIPGVEDIICDVIGTSINVVCQQAAMRTNHVKMGQISPIEVMEYVCDMIRREMKAPFNVSNWILVGEDSEFRFQLIFELVVLPEIYTGLYIMISKISDKYNVFYLPKELVDDEDDEDDLPRDEFGNYDPKGNF